MVRVTIATSQNLVKVTIINVQLVDCLLEVNLADLACHDLHHLLANVSALRTLGVGGLLNLIRLTLCESNTEQTKIEAISSLHINVCLN